MKLVKTGRRSRLGDDTLGQAMRVCIEAPGTLGNEQLEAIVTCWKGKKPRRLAI